ncbi:MAG: SGNH/GDSL hydrolase family protein [Thermocrispum sp.]
MHRFTSFMALGDSFTEGMTDVLPDGTYRGWADRLAEILADGNPDFSYANPALRGKMLQEIVDEQLPMALAARPDLVTVCAGGNDIVSPGSNIDQVGAVFDDMVRQLVDAGIDVLIFTGPDVREVAVVNRLRGKVALYNAHLHSIAQKYRTRMVDLWAMESLKDPRAFAEDRLHFSPEAHRRIALRVAEELGVPTAHDWREPWPEFERPDWLRMRRDDLAWTRTYLLPWIKRLIRGESMGDGLEPKRPRLAPYVPPRDADALAHRE